MSPENGRENEQQLTRCPILALLGCCLVLIHSQCHILYLYTHLHPARTPRPLPLARPAGVLRGDEAHEVLGRLVAGVAAPQPEVDASLAAEKRDAQFKLPGKKWSLGCVDSPPTARELHCISTIMEYSLYQPRVVWVVT